MVTTADTLMQPNVASSPKNSNWTYTVKQSSITEINIEDNAIDDSDIHTDSII